MIKILYSQYKALMRVSSGRFANYETTICTDELFDCEDNEKTRKKRTRKEKKSMKKEGSGGWKVE